MGLSEVRCDCRVCQLGQKLAEVQAREAALRESLQTAQRVDCAHATASERQEARDRWTAALATKPDDSALRELLRTTVMRTWMKVVARQSIQTVVDEILGVKP